MNSAGQALVKTEIGVLLSRARTTEEAALIGSLATAALWAVKPIHIRELKHMTLQCFSSDVNAWMSFFFSRENCEILLQVTDSAFGHLIEVVYKDDTGKAATRMFDMDDRGSFVSTILWILYQMNIEVRKVDNRRV